MKDDVEYLEPMWPMRHFLITSGQTVAARNIISVSFCFPVSKDPALVGISIMKSSYSYELISGTKEFAVNIPPKELESKVYYCGFHSGRDVDKFRETGLTPSDAKALTVPIIEECIAHMECVTLEEIVLGDKVLIVGRVMESYSDKNRSSKMPIEDFAHGKFPRNIYGGRFSSKD